MTVDDIRTLFEYDRWANARVFDAISNLTAEQFNRDLGGSFRSVRDTLLHLIGGEWIWLQYWRAPPASPLEVEELVVRRDAEFHTPRYPTFESVRTKWKETEAEQIAFVNGLTDELVHQPIPFRGLPFPLSDLMQHVANHSTYHRGQIAHMLRQLGVKPVATDFHVFRFERLGSSGTGRS
jgi:uncharacterized damage-inducible protein DinB